MKKPPRITARRAAIIEEVHRLHTARLADLLAVLPRFLHGNDSLAQLRNSIEKLFPALWRTAVLHGYMIAILATRMDIGKAKVGEADDLAEFGEIERETYEQSLDYWKKKFKLTPEQLGRVEKSISGFMKHSGVSMDKLVGEAMDTLVESFSEASTLGLDAKQFARRIGDTLEGVTKAQAETAFRTTMTESYGKKRVEQIEKNKKTVPFTQFIGLTDDRQTLSICKPMSGYIATSDDPIWKIWVPPNHYDCRSDLSPISYPEAIRMGILVRNADRSFSYPKGKRPFGDPPKFAINEKGDSVKVEPAPGFGG